MFERTLIVPDTYGRKPFAFVASTLVQVALILLMIVIPLVSTDVIPSVFLHGILRAPSVPPPASPVVPESMIAATQPVREFQRHEIFEPREIPAEIAVIVEEMPPAPNGMRLTDGVIGITTGMSSGQATAAVWDVVQRQPLPAPPTEIKPEPKPVRRAPVRVRAGGQVSPPALLKRVPPVYPPLARQARIQGVVKLNAIVDIGGRVNGLRVVSGHPLLAPAAAEAVKQWIYRPTLLNGDPVEVVLAVEVKFLLGR